jgi:hypothetical protein
LITEQVSKFEEIENLEGRLQDLQRQKLDLEEDKRNLIQHNANLNSRLERLEIERRRFIYPRTKPKAENPGQEFDDERVEPHKVDIVLYERKNSMLIILVASDDIIKNVRFIDLRS